MLRLRMSAFGRKADMVAVQTVWWTRAKRIYLRSVVLNLPAHSLHYLVDVLAGSLLRAACYLACYLWLASRS